MERRWLGVIVGALGIYLLIDAGLVGVGMLEFQSAFHRPPMRGVQQTEEEIKLGRYLLATFVVLVVLGTSTVLACIGFVRRSHWAKALWCVTSTAILVATVVAVVESYRDWTQHLYVMVGVAVAWWALWQLEKRERREA